WLALQFPLRDLRELEQRGDELLHARGGAANAAEIVGSLLAQPPAVLLGQRLAESLDGAQRRAEVVRHGVAKRGQLLVVALHGHEPPCTARSITAATCDISYLKSTCAAPASNKPSMLLRSTSPVSTISGMGRLLCCSTASAARASKRGRLRSLITMSNSSAWSTAAISSAVSTRWTVASKPPRRR